MIGIGGIAKCGKQAPHIGRLDHRSDFLKAVRPLKSTQWRQRGGLRTVRFQP